MSEDKTQDTINVEDMSDEELNKELEVNPEDAAKEVQDQQGKAEAEGDTTPTEAELERERADRAELRLKEKELMLQRQANELGDLRKKAYAPATEEEKAQWTKRIEDGDTTVYDEIATKEKEGAKVEQQELTILQEINKSAIMDAVPDFEQLKGDIAKEALNNGYSVTDVEGFKNNPFGASDPQIVIRLANQVRKSKEIEQLRQENKRIKDNKTGDIENAANKPSSTVITGGTGGSATEGVSTLDSIPLHKMTDAQLDQALAENKRAAGYN